jgi:hypothetical protein
MLELFAKVNDIEDLNDLESLRMTNYQSDKTDKENKEYMKRENEKIQYLLKIKRDLE